MGRMRRKRYLNLRERMQTAWFTALADRVSGRKKKLFFSKKEEGFIPISRPTEICKSENPEPIALQRIPGIFFARFSMMEFLNLL